MDILPGRGGHLLEDALGRDAVLLGEPGEFVVYEHLGFLLPPPAAKCGFRVGLPGAVGEGQAPDVLRGRGMEAVPDPRLIFYHRLNVIQEGVTMSIERWGCFSVKDHKRPRAFIADVVLYDRLVVPYPSDEPERKEWKKNKWAPERLLRMLDALGDLAIPVAWNDYTRDIFNERYRAAQGAEGDARALASSANDKAAMFRIDGENATHLNDEVLPDGLRQAFFRQGIPISENASVSVKTKSTHWLILDEENHGVFSAKSEDDGISVYEKLDPFFVTRMLLTQDFLPSIHGVEPRAVAAYPSYNSFRKDFSLDGNRAQSDKLGWMMKTHFLVPRSSIRSDVNFLRKVVKLIGTDEFKEKRRLFYACQEKAIAEGATEAYVTHQLSKRINDYNAAVKDAMKEVYTKSLFTVFKVLLDVVSAPLNPITYAKSGVEIAQFLKFDRKPKLEEPESAPVAMFHALRTYYRIVDR